MKPPGGFQFGMQRLQSKMRLDGRLLKLTAFYKQTSCSSKLVLIILLALLVGVLYCLHLLVRDYQALSAGRLFSFLSKRDVHAQHYSKPTVRWKKILQYDPLHCARSLYCDIGARPAVNEIRRGFTIMLTLEALEEDKIAKEEFIKAYTFGHQRGTDQCRTQYPMCPFKPSLLFEVVQFLVKNPSTIVDEPDKKPKIQ